MANPFSLKEKAKIGPRLLLGAGVVLMLLFPHANISDPSPDEEPATVLDAYGIDWKNYEVEEQPIQRNQTFSTILAAHSVPTRVINRVIEKARPVFNLRHLQAGKPLRIYQDAAGQTARLVVYQPTPENYIVFDLRDSLKVYEGRHAVTVKRRAVSGVITASPYQTLEEQGTNPALAVHLSKVFDWQIDFYRIRHGDRFNIIYDERVVAGKSVGVKIIATRFEHAGKDFYAFRVNEGDEDGYFNERGHTLRRTFLKAPLEYSRISSRYSKRRFHPVQKRYKPHLGTDYAAPTGTPILATPDGEVTAASYTKGNGRYVKIRHNGTYPTGYLHMSRIAKGIRNGRRVQQGEVIGYVGSTGLATGPHLCYRFWMNDKQVDPLKLNLPTSEPIADRHRPAFTAVRGQLMPLLQFPDEPPMQVVELPGAQEATPKTQTNVTAP